MRFVFLALVVLTLATATAYVSHARHAWRAEGPTDCGFGWRDFKDL